MKKNIRDNKVKVYMCQYDWYYGYYYDDDNIYYNIMSNLGYNNNDDEYIRYTLGNDGFIDWSDEYPLSKKRDILINSILNEVINTKTTIGDYLDISLK